MKYFLLTFIMVSTNASFLARVRNHWEEKTKRPECHIEFEDVTEPHCETITEQVMRAECAHTLLWSVLLGVLGGVEEPMQDGVHHIV